MVFARSDFLPLFPSLLIPCLDSPPSSHISGLLSLTIHPFLIAVRLLLVLGANGHIADEKNHEPLVYARQSQHTPAKLELERWAEAEVHKIKGNGLFKNGAQ
jgi:hypothetical protein